MSKNGCNSNREYYGFTYPLWMRHIPFWKQLMCKRGRHLWDEVLSGSGTEPGNHYLVCDVCETEIEIARVNFHLLEI